MVNEKSTLKTILYLCKRSQLKFILFIISIIGSFLFYYNDTLAVNEIANKSSLNNNSSSFLQIPSENNNTKTNNNSELVFSNVTNITNNQKDSVYAQIAANDNNVYVVWQESVTEKPDEKNYDIFFTESEDNGTTFSKPINLSNNTGFSEHPQIAISKNGIFVIWGDNTDSNNTEIMFTESEDNGTTFSKPVNLSNSLQNSNNQEISVFNENVYVVWQDIDQNNSQKNSSIFFKRSIDSGNTFNDVAIELANNIKDAYPKINSYREHVYVVWNSEDNNNSGSENDDKNNDDNSGLFFIKSSDKGNSFENSIRITDYNFGESQIAVNQSEIFIAWGGLHAKNIKDIYFVQSDDNGTNFTDPYIILEKVTATAQSKNNAKLTDKIIKYPTNVEIAHDNPLYIVWQDKISEENHDIFIASNIKNDFQSANIMNLSNNTGISECPQIAVSKNYLYLVWEDITPGNHEIFYTRGIIKQNN
jgi:hypothetical protein